MKRKYFFLASIAALGMSLGSCSSELDAPVANGDGVVTFTASLPSGLATRAYSDGTGADQLQYAVYQVGDNNTSTLVFSSNQADAPKATYNNDLTFSLSLNLVKGQTYDFIFWADKKGNTAYTFNPDNKNITISYGDDNSIDGNDETRDAFFTAEKGLTVTGAIQKNIELYRPFAQLNVGTNDIEVAERAGVKLGKTQVVVKDVYNTLNLYTGVASGNAEVTYTYAEVPENETFPVAGYDYLSMNYILTGSQLLADDSDNVNQAQKETKDITIAIQDENQKNINTFNLSAVPFQRNYRTNIYGALLTSTVDFVIEVVPDYNDPDYELSKLLVAAAAGGKVVLEDDVTVPSGTKFTKNAIIDLNGKNITFEKTTNASCGFRVEGAEAILVIEGEGTLTAADGVIPVGSFGGAKVVINGGTFVGAKNVGAVDEALECIYLKDNGSIEINGGTFSAAVPRNGWYYVLNQHNEATGTFVVKGGQFINYNPATGDDYLGGNFVANGYKSVEQEINDQKVYTVVPNGTAVVTDALQLSSALADGGSVMIAATLDEIDLTTATPAEPLVLTLSANVDKIKLGTTTENPKATTIVVNKDVKYPEFVLPGANSDKAIRNLTIIGDLTSSERCSGFNAQSKAKIDGLTIENVPFTGKGVNVAWNAYLKNITVKNCDFVELTEPAFCLQMHEDPTTHVTNGNIENIVVEGNTIKYADNAPETVNGIYLHNTTGGFVIVKNNVIDNSPYHGIFLKNHKANVTVEGNIITNFKEDGIKVDLPQGNININKNEIKFSNIDGVAIRLARFYKKYNTPVITVKSNVIRVMSMFTPGISLGFKSEAGAKVDFIASDNSITNINPEQGGLISNALDIKVSVENKESYANAFKN